jgi:hypothetical protein
VIPSDVAPPTSRSYWRDRCQLVLTAIVIMIVWVAGTKLYLAAVNWLLFDLMGVPNGPIWPSE